MKPAPPVIKAFDAPVRPGFNVVIGCSFSRADFRFMLDLHW